MRLSKPVNGRRLRNIQRLALRNAFGNIEHDDVAKIFQTRHMGKRAADHAGADKCDFIAGHGVKSPWDQSYDITASSPAAISRVP